jgi:phage tail sheath protein FI
MAFNVGVNLVEVDGRAAPAIARAPISVAGFLVRSSRGVPNQPINVTSFRTFEDNFGTYRADTFGAHAVRGFFDNGGTEAYVVRVVGSGSATASAMLSTPTPAPTLRVAAGVHGREDPGAWGNDLSVLVADHPRGESPVPAQLQSSAPEPYALADGDALDITVNGIAPPVSIVFAAADFANIASATAAEVAAAINRRTTAVRATVTPAQRLLIASSTPGFSSALALAGTAVGTATTKLKFTTVNTSGGLPGGADSVALTSGAGFAPRSAVRLETPGHVVGTAPIATSFTAGSGIVVTVDGTPVTVTFAAADFVNGINAATPGEAVAAINRQAHGFTAGLTSGGLLVLASVTYGPSSTIAVGAAPGGDARTPLGLATATPVAGSRQFREVVSTADDGKLVTVGAGVTGPVPTIVARMQSVEFDLVVRRGGLEVERFTSVSMQDQLDYYVEAVVNDPDSGSRYVAVTDQDLAAPGTDAPAAGATPLAGGNDGGAVPDNRYVGDPAARTGLYAFDTVRVQLIATPETTSPGVTTGALGYCERRGDAMFVGTAPRGYDLDGIKGYAAAFRGRKVYGALYAPWIDVSNPLDVTGDNPTITIPPVGQVLGAYARIGEARGVWKAPAGDEANLAGALAAEFPMTDTDLTDLVKEGGVNGIRAVRGTGIIVETSRTLSSDTRWLFVGTRRLFNFVKSSLRDGLRWVPQEPHDESLRRRVKFNAVTPFLLGLWRQGAFGSDPAEDVFTIRCDAENNPPAEVNLGNFKVEVYFYPVKPAETIVIVVGQQESGASANEG